MKNITTLITVLTIAAAPIAHAQLVVAAPAMEARQDQKNIFDTLKYAWEQAQWTEKLGTLHTTLTTVQEQLETANQVKQAIGDPAAVIGLIDNGLFSDYLNDSGVLTSLESLNDIMSETMTLADTIQNLFSPIEIGNFTDLEVAFHGSHSFRDRNDPLKPFRTVNNAYTKLEKLLSDANTERSNLNRQIARFNDQLKGAADDAEVQKLVGSLTTAQAALDDLDAVTSTAQHQVELLHVLNENRAAEEKVAAEEIHFERERRAARNSADAIRGFNVWDLK